MSGGGGSHHEGFRCRRIPKETWCALGMMFWQLFDLCKATADKSLAREGLVRGSAVFPIRSSASNLLSSWQKTVA